MGTAAASAGAAGLSEGSGRTKPEYTAASRRRDDATFGSGPTRQSDDRDSEPDYLLRPTMSGGTLHDYSSFRFSAQITVQAVGISNFTGRSSTSSSERSVPNQQ